MIFDILLSILNEGRGEFLLSTANTEHCIFFPVHVLWEIFLNVIMQLPLTWGAKRLPLCAPPPPIPESIMAFEYGGRSRAVYNVNVQKSKMINTWC